MTYGANSASAWRRKGTVGQWVYTAFAMSISIAGIWAFEASRFVPTRLGDEVALAIALMVSALAAWFAATSYIFSKDNPNSKALFERTPGFASAPTRIGVLAGLAFFFTFPAVESGFLEWWTWIVGTTGEQSATVSDFHLSRHACDGFSLREAPFLTHTAVCSYYLYGKAPPPGTPITLYGVASPFGIDVRSFKLGAYAAPAS